MSYYGENVETVERTGPWDDLCFRVTHTDQTVTYLKYAENSEEFEEATEADWNAALAAIGEG